MTTRRSPLMEETSNNSPVVGARYSESFPLAFCRAT